MSDYEYYSSDSESSPVAFDPGEETGMTIGVVLSRQEQHFEDFMDRVYDSVLVDSGLTLENRLATAVRNMFIRFASYRSFNSFPDPEVCFRRLQECANALNTLTNKMLEHNSDNERACRYLRHYRNVVREILLTCADEYSEIGALRV